MVILGITWMAICSQVYNTWAQSRRLAAMVKQTVVVRRLLPGDPREGGRASESIDAADLVPGDIIAIDAGTHPLDLTSLSA
jgi:magnesium-transporting ATPase (P-type)